MTESNVLLDKTLKLRDAVNDIELALMGIDDLHRVAALFEEQRDGIDITVRIKVGQLKQLCAALNRCNQLINHPDYTPAQLKADACR